MKKLESYDNAKFKCTREHILDHDWPIKITWNYARLLKLVLRREGWVQYPGPRDFLLKLYFFYLESCDAKRW